MKNFKKVISAVVALALSASTFVSASNFTDVADTASYAEAIDVLSALGIVNGYAEEDGTFTFKPEGTITRAEAATMIVGALNMTADAQASAGTSKFADVNSQASWAAGYVNVGVAQGFISGMDETTFAPQENVTYAQMCVMLTSIAGYGEYAAKNGGYPTGYTSMAASTGINKGVAVSNDTALTRGQVAQMIWNALQAPMLGVYEYSFQGNTYTQLDGKSGRDFKTLLSDKFDGYVVTAEILATAKSSAAVENGEATIDVAKADWWDDEVVPCGVVAHTNHNETVILNGISLDDQLYQMGKAVLVINEEDDVELVYFAANTKTETKEFAAEDYVPQAKLGTSNRYGDTAITSPSPTTAPGIGKIRFGSKYMTMDTAGVDLYVNGKSYTTLSATNTGANATLDTFLKNAQGTIKLIKQDTDNGYSKIFVDYYDVAEVISVDYKNGQTTVLMAPAANAVANVRKLVVNDDAVEDGDVDITVKKGGAEIELKDLQKEDIVAYAIDLLSATSPMTDPAYISVIATNDTVEGKVTGDNTDDQKFAIDGTEYACVNYAAASLTVGDSYKLTLDPFGRIFDYEEDASSTKYAIVEKWNSSAETVSLLLADGTTKAYELASNATIQDASGNPISLTGSSSLIYKADGTTKNDPQNRVVEYTIKTSDNTIRTIKLATPVQLHSLSAGAEYKARTNKLGSATINASTNVVNAEDYIDPLNSNPGLSDYEAFSVDSFVDGTDYDAYAYKSAGSNTYSFVLVTRVGSAFNETSRFAVVTRVKGQTTYNEEDAYEVEVLAGGEATSLYYYANPSSTVDTGDAIYFELDSDGFVKATYKVFDYDAAKLGNTTNGGSVDLFRPFTHTTLATAMAGKYQTGSDGWNFNLYDNGNDIQLVYAVVAEVAGNNVTLAPIPVTGANIDTNNDVASASATIGGNTYAVDSEAEIYVYDTADTQSINEYDKLYTGSVIASNFSMFETAKNSKTYTIDSGDHDGTVETGEENRDNYTNYALAMIVDGDIVEIYPINK